VPRHVEIPPTLTVGDLSFTHTCTCDRMGKHIFLVIADFQLLKI